LLIIKTKVSAYKKVEETLRKNHSYEVPEIICLPIAKGSKTYLDWIAEIVAE
jgi:periplasmic divalent cation tolerance protein